MNARPGPRAGPRRKPWRLRGGGASRIASVLPPIPTLRPYHAYPGVPTALVGATVYDGAGGRIDNGTVLFAEGKVVAIGGSDLAIPAGYTRIDGSGKFVTPGVIDIHSHLGDYPSPGVAALQDGNEATDPTTPRGVGRALGLAAGPGLHPRARQRRGDHAEILPGSANLMGGRSVTLKNVPARTVQGMKFPGRALFAQDGLRREPQAGLRRSKGACPRRGWATSRSTGRRGSTRASTPTATARSATSRWRRSPACSTAKILVQNHCYRADEMALVLDMAKEMGYHVAAFHHAVESYKIADLLREAGVCSAVWADWYGLQDGGLRRHSPRTPR
jgi:imidazolonepropionase-like amidohydrolase